MSSVWKNNKIDSNGNNQSDYRFNSNSNTTAKSDLKKDNDLRNDTNMDVKNDTDLLNVKIPNQYKQSNKRQHIQRRRNRF